MPPNLVHTLTNCVRTKFPLISMTQRVTRCRPSSAIATSSRAGSLPTGPRCSRLIDVEGFPAGTMIGANTRAWRVDEIERWLASRPTGKEGDARGRYHARPPPSR